MVHKSHVLVCGGTGCLSAKSDDIVDNINKILTDKNLKDMVKVVKTGCFGFCEKGPIVKIVPDNTFYVEVKPEDAGRIVENHIINNEILEDRLYIDPRNNQKVKEGENFEFYKKQMRVALANCGFLFFKAFKIL